jgi:hypothetical protein
MPQLRFSPGEKTTGTHWIGGWLRAIAGMDTEDRGKILCVNQRSNLGHLVHSQDSKPTELSHCIQFVYNKFKKLLKVGETCFVIIVLRFHSPATPSHKDTWIHPWSHHSLLPLHWVGWIGCQLPPSLFVHDRAETPRPLKYLT